MARYGNFFAVQQAYRSAERTPKARRTMHGTSTFSTVMHGKVVTFGVYEALRRGLIKGVYE